MNFTKLICVVTMALLAALTGAVPAHATFRGQNGRIAFDQGSPTTDIYTMNPDGSDVKQLTFFAGSGGYATLGAWSPDGNQIAFTATNSAANGPYQLWIMNGDGSNQHVLLNDDPSHADWVPNFSPDGSHIVFTRCGPINCAIYRVNRDGSGLKAITPFKSDRDIIDWFPAYSPDGNTIAFTSYWRDGLIEAVYLMNADGSGIHSFTPPALGGYTPDWSPDGNSIAFATNDSNDPTGCNCWVLSGEIWTIDTDDRETNRLTFNNRHWNGINSVPHDFLPSWSPEGDAIVFERAAPDFSSSALYVMNSDGSNQRLVMRLSSSTYGAFRQPERSFGPTKGSRLDMLHRIEQGGSSPRWGAAPQGHAH